MTFYFDASIQSHVAEAIASVRDDVLYAGGPSAPARNTPDADWLALAGAEDWVVLMRDKKIRSRPWERAALMEAGVRAFCLTASGNASKWATLELIVTRWRRLEEVASTEPGPFIYSVTGEGVRRLASP